MDDLEIGNKFADMVGMSRMDDKDKEGKYRMSSEYITENLGATFIFIFSALLLVTTIVAFLAWCSKRQNKVSPACREKIQKVKNKVFFNPLISYSMLNSMKLSMIAVTAIGGARSDPTQIVVGSLLFTALVATSVVYQRLLKRRSDKLACEQNKATIGSLYAGLKLDQADSKLEEMRDRRVHLYPMLFIHRRIAFIIFCCFLLYDHPVLQFQLHICMNLANLCY